MNLGSFMPPEIAKMWAKIIIFINNIAIIWELIGGNNLKFAKDWDKIIFSNNQLNNFLFFYK